MLFRRFFCLLFVTLSLMCITSPIYAQDPFGKEYVAEEVAPEEYLENASYKLVRGVTNLVTCPGEIPKQIVVTTRERGALGVVLGIFKGLGMTVVRGSFGVWEGVTFFLPNSIDGDYSPILNPEFVWNRTTYTN